MRFDQGARVFSIDGRPLGRLDRVVLDPRTKEITQVVIRTRALMAQDKVVPLDLVEADEQERLIARLDARQLTRMPDFGVMHYRVVSEEELARDENRTSRFPGPATWYSSYLTTISLSLVHSQMKGTRLNITAGAVPLTVGAKVISADGKRVGHVQRVLTSPPSDRVGYLQISKGRRSRETRLIPMEWVEQIEEDQVYLGVGECLIQELPE